MHMVTQRSTFLHIPQGLEEYGGVPHPGRTKCLIFFLVFFQPITIEYSKISGKMQKSRSKQITQAISVNVAQLGNKQMNENNVESKADLNKFKNTDLRKMGKQKTQFNISALMVSASIILSFSVIMDFNFVRKTFSQ